MEGKLRLKKYLLVFTLAPSIAVAADLFGAIAYSKTTGAHGWAKDHPSREAAEGAALSACAQNAKDCQPLFWFKNACAALAVDASANAGWGWGITQKLADAEAVKACRKQAKGCKIRRRVCTAGAG
jgi:serine/threonine-protein kinase